MAGHYLKRVEKVRFKMDFTKNSESEERQVFGFELLVFEKGMLSKIFSVSLHAY